MKISDWEKVRTLMNEYEAVITTIEKLNEPFFELRGVLETGNFKAFPVIPDKQDRVELAVFTAEIMNRKRLRILAELGTLGVYDDTTGTEQSNDKEQS